MSENLVLILAPPHLVISRRTLFIRRNLRPHTLNRRLLLLILFLNNIDKVRLRHLYLIGVMTSSVFLCFFCPSNVCLLLNGGKFFGLCSDRGGLFSQRFFLDDLVQIHYLLCILVFVWLFALITHEFFVVFCLI